MPSIKKWFHKAVDSIVDPNRESRINSMAQLLAGGLRQHKQNFRVSTALSDINYSEDDLMVASERVFRAILERGWQDGNLSPAQQETARWVSRVLSIHPNDAQRLNLEIAKGYFRDALANAMDDDVLDAPEIDRLNQIASSVGTSTPQFLRTYFLQDGETFLRAIFLACVSDGQLSNQEWQRLLNATQKLGITQEEMLKTIQPQAHRFVEHVLADAKADGILSPTEQETLYWLLTVLQLPAQFHNYVLAEVKQLQVLSDIQNGMLPTIPPPAGAAVKAGEIIHCVVPATFQQTRMLKSGPRTYEHYGTLIVTDNRIMFSGETKSAIVTYRTIVSHRGSTTGIEVDVARKPTFRFLLKRPQPITYAVVAAAVARTNQKQVSRLTGTPSRHILREVRQRTWQKYGGQCVECNATDYLEYDHIIPVAKGGSNSDENIQILCRRCNLKKSAHI